MTDPDPDYDITGISKSVPGLVRVFEMMDEPAGRAKFLLWSAVMLAALAALALVLHEGYPHHTDRAQAVVSREAAESAMAAETVYVDYRAEGRRYTGAELDGLMEGPARFAYFSCCDTGDTLSVAYDPARPGDPVTAVAASERADAWHRGVVTLMLTAAGACLVGSVSAAFRARSSRTAP